MPFGFRVEGKGKEAVLVPIPEEQEVISLIVEGQGLGLSLRATAEYVTERLGRKVDWNLVRRVVDRMGGVE